MSKAGVEGTLKRGKSDVQAQVTKVTYTKA
jgi:hypothetical protein